MRDIEDTGAVYTKKTRDRIDRLEDVIASLEKEITRHMRAISELRVGECPIKAGDVIEWLIGSPVGDKKRVGQVITVTPDDYQGRYGYRCAVLSLDGRAIGFANIDDSKQPVLVAKTVAAFVKANNIKKTSKRK